MEVAKWPRAVKKFRMMLLIQLMSHIRIILPPAEAEELAIINLDLYELTSYLVDHRDHYHHRNHLVYCGDAGIAK